MSNDENKFQPIFQILHIKIAWFLLELAMALVTTIGMRFLQVCKNQLKSAYNTYFYKDWHCGTIVIKIVSIAGVGGSNNRSSSLGRNTSLFNHIANQDRTSLDKFKQVTRQSALSPQQNNGNTSDDRESCV